MLTKINQREDDKYYIISHICGILKKSQIHINRNSEEKSGCQGLVRGEWW